MSRRKLGPFVGVAWGVPSLRGVQRAHIVTGRDITAPVRSLCGRSYSSGSVWDYTAHGRPMVSCRSCRRAAAAHLTELPTGETPARRWP